jgi:site-specific DNA-methyltransferase (adenine-specific)
MTPYYERDGITIYHGDCREVLPTLQAGSVDLVLTDPPYGISYVSNMRNRITKERGKHQRPLVGDDSVPVDVLPLITRCLRDQSGCYWFCNERGIEAFYQAVGLAGLTARRMLVWDKQLHSMGDLYGAWAARCEYVPWAVKGRHILRGPRRANLISVVQEAHRAQPGHGHPTEKPVPLLRHIIIASSDTGHTVLDPFMGSGSSLRAARDLGRRAIGIEIEERYCEIAARRLSQTVLPLDWAAAD